MTTSKHLLMQCGACLSGGKKGGRESKRRCLLKNCALSFDCGWGSIKDEGEIYAMFRTFNEYLLESGCDWEG